MYTVALFATIFAICTPRFGYEHKARISWPIRCTLMAGLGGFLGSVLSLCLGLFLLPPATVQTLKFELSEVNDKQATSGTFLLSLPGRRPTDSIYLASIKSNDGGVQPWAMTAHNGELQIIENPSLHGRGMLIIRSETPRTGSLSKWLMDPMFIEGARYEFDIPTGSFLATAQVSS